MATRRTLDSIPPGWIEYEAGLTPVAAFSDGMAITDPAEIAAFCQAVWARDADYLAAMEIINGIGPEGIDSSRQCVNGMVEISLTVLDPTPYREAVAAVIPESRVRIF